MKSQYAWQIKHEGHCIFPRVTVVCILYIREQGLVNLNTFGFSLFHEHRMDIICSLQLLPSNSVPLCADECGLYVAFLLTLSTRGFFCLFNNTWQRNRLFCTWQPETPMKTRSSVFVTSPSSSQRWTGSSSLIVGITFWLIHSFAFLSDQLSLVAYLRGKEEKLVLQKCWTSAFSCLWEGCLFSGVEINPLFDMLHLLCIHTGRKRLTFFPFPFNTNCCNKPRQISFSNSFKLFLKVLSCTHVNSAYILGKINFLGIWSNRSQRTARKIYAR